MQWSEKALAQVMRNPAVKGTRVYRPTLPDGSYADEPEVTAVGNWSPILDAETWQQTVEVLDARRARRTTWPGTIKRVHPFSGLIRCSSCGTAMRKQGKVYICVAYQRGVCSRSINAQEITTLIEEAVLSVFARIALTPDSLPSRTPGAEGARERDELAESLQTDRATLERLDDDHYDGIIERATWMRQRSRLIERITARQRQYQQQLARIPVVHLSLDLGTVATEWPDRNATWQHEASRMVLESVLIHAHPEGVASIVAKRKTDTDQTYQARLRQHREDLLALRVELVWHA